MNLGLFQQQCTVPASPISVPSFLAYGSNTMQKETSIFSSQLLTFVVHPRKNSTLQKAYWYTFRSQNNTLNDWEIQVNYNEAFITISLV